MRKLISSLMLAAAVASPVTMAAEAAQPLYVGPMASYYWLDGDRPYTNVNHDQPAIGAVLGWNIDSVQAWEMSYQIDPDGADLNAFQLNYVRKMSEGQKWTPYVLGGVSLFIDDNAPNNDDSMQIQVGAGVSTFIQEDLELRADVRPFYSIGGNNDGHGFDVSANAALLWHFGAVEKPAPVVAPAPAPAPKAPEMRSITVRLNVLFDFDKSEVKAVFGNELNDIAAAMKAQPDLELVLEGHTDSVGTDAYNQGLSQRRVEAVKMKLVQDYGVPANRITTQAYGESRPIASNDNADGRAQNRRVVGVVSWTEEVK